MARLVFDGDGVERLMLHARTSPAHGKSYFADEGTEHPQIVFVHDHGLYLMSNGEGGEELPEPQRVVHARGYDPALVPFDEWYYKAIDAVGGDDFAEFLDFDTLLPRPEGTTVFVINVTKRTLTARWAQR